MPTTQEVRNRNYTYCTIDSGEYGQFLAKVAYKERSNAWGPTEVFFNGKWISIDEFDDMDGYNAYGCSDYRKDDSSQSGEFLCVEDGDYICKVQCPYCESL